MRDVKASAISDMVRKLFMEANVFIGKDVLQRLKQCEEQERSEIGKSVLRQIIENDGIAAEEKVPICQDTGMAVLFVDLGQEVHVVDGGFQEAIEEGVRRAYMDGYLRKSVVSDPLFERKNTKDNTPSITHLRVVPGDRIRILVAPKGFG
ncbi:MAG: fumarate hydratase, partial [Bacillota bacterium]